MSEFLVPGSVPPPLPDRYVRRLHLSRFAIGLIMCIIVAIVMTSLSVYMYVGSGVVNLDLSRPGYEQARKEIQTHDNEAAFSSSGRLTASAMEDFAKLYKLRIDQLKGSGTFHDATLDDNNIGLPIAEAGL